MATVSAGMVTAKAAGTATITAKTSNGKIASCTVTVTKPAESTAQTNFKKVVSYIETYYDGINSYGNKFISLAIDSNSIVGLSYESSENKLTITFLYETETTGGTSKNGVSINLCYNSLSKVSVEVLHILNEKYNFKTGTVIDPSSYTYDSNISFSLVSASTDIITSDIRQSLLDLSNSLLKGAVLSAGMLMTYNGMDISDLGFTSFMLY